MNDVGHDEWRRSPLDARGRDAASAIQTFTGSFAFEVDGRSKPRGRDTRSGRVGSSIGAGLVVAMLIGAVAIVATRNGDSPTKVQVGVPGSSSTASADPNALVTLVLKPAHGTLSEQQLATAAQLLLQRARLLDGRPSFLGTVGHSDHDITMQIPSSVARFGHAWLTRGAIANREVLAARPWNEPMPPGTDETVDKAKGSTSRPGGQTCKDLVDGASFWSDAVLVGGAHKVCYALGSNLLSGSDATRADARFDESDKGWGVDVTYKSGSFVRIARDYVNKRVAIVLDDRVLSAPVINQGITGDHVRITGGLTEQSAKILAAALAGGELPADFIVVNR